MESNLMQLNENLYKLYEAMYGSTFNRTLLIGSVERGYSSHLIHDIDEISKIIEKTNLNDELYISLYDYDTDENISRWMKTDINKFISTARKNCLIIRFRENYEIVKEEVRDLSDIQKFMFIRRTINLGLNEKIVDECKKTYKFLEEKLDIKAFCVFNGINECSLYVYFDEIKFENPTETLYYLYTYLQRTLNLDTITYADIEPFSQITTLMGSQNTDSKLYVKPFDVDWEYNEIIKNSSDVNSNILLPDKNQNNSKLNKLLEKIDSEITKTKSKGKKAFEIDIDDI